MLFHASLWRALCLYHRVESRLAAGWSPDPNEPGALEFDVLEPRYDRWHEARRGLPQIPEQAGACGRRAYQRRLGRDE